MEFGKGNVQPANLARVPHSHCGLGSSIGIDLSRHFWLVRKEQFWLAAQGYGTRRMNRGKHVQGNGVLRRSNEMLLGVSMKADCLCLIANL